MTDVTIHDLDNLWEDSTDEPLALYEGEDPTVETGSYVIEPGDRVPTSGMTSHGGDEISVILEGELRLVTDGDDRLVGPNTLTVIPKGVEHYSINPGPEPVRLVYTVLGDL